MKPYPLLNIRPLVFDGFGFYAHPQTKEIVFNYFDDVAREHGAIPGDPTIPTDREAYHVILSSVRKGRVHIERPFTSNFLDAFVYAAHMARSGFTGVMIRVNKYSMAILDATLVEMLTLHSKGYGFVMANDHGVDVFYEGIIKERTK
jgi:hypothetical protein